MVEFNHEGRHAPAVGRSAAQHRHAAVASGAACEPDLPAAGGGQGFGHAGRRPHRPPAAARRRPAPTAEGAAAARPTGATAPQPALSARPHTGSPLGTCSTRASVRCTAAAATASASPSSPARRPARRPLRGRGLLERLRPLIGQESADRRHHQQRHQRRRQPDAGTTAAAGCARWGSDSPALRTSVPSNFALDLTINPPDGRNGVPSGGGGCRPTLRAR